MDNEKKQRIINASINLFAERGIAKVSVPKIAKELGVTKGMVYHYFKKGKKDIITAILQMYEASTDSCVPDPQEWEAKDTDAEKILYKLFFRFPSSNMLQLRKIVRIIMSEMYHDKQIAQHGISFFINGREKLLSDCFTALANNGKISPIDTESAARYFNRLLLVYAIEDALRFPYIDDTEKAEAQQERAVRDCTNFINFLLAKNQVN